MLIKTISENALKRELFKKCCTKRMIIVPLDS